MQIKSNALTSVEILADYLDLNATNDENILTLCINLATAFIEGYTGRFFEFKDRTQYLPANKTKAFLKAIPIDAVTWVKDGDGVELDYKIVSRTSGVVSFDLVDNENDLSISYTGGYLIDFDQVNDEVAHTLPLDLTNLCNEIAGKIYNKRKSQGISNESLEGQNINWEKEIAPETKAILDKYKLKYFV